MLSEMEDGGHPILEHMDQVVGKLRQVHTTVRLWGGINVDGCASVDVRARISKNTPIRVCTLCPCHLLLTGSDHVYTSWCAFRIATLRWKSC